MEKTTHHRLQFQFIFCIILIAVLLIPANFPVSASPLYQDATGGLQVNGAILNLPATPGMTYTHRMVVGDSAKAPPMDVAIEIVGFGQAADGTPQAIPAAEDKSPFSAVSYITGISKTSFHLDPGQSVPVEATIKVPDNFGTESHYAGVYIKGTPAGSNSVTQILAVIVPIIISPQGTQLSKTGEISDVTVDTVEPGKPMVVTTTVKNTGTTHFKIQGDVKILDSSGQVVADLQVPVTSNSVIPGFSRQFVVSYSALDHSGGLAAGKYTADVQVSREDGSSVGSKQIQFEVAKTYRPFPEVADENMLIQCFKDEEPGVVDARQKTDAMVTFTNTGKVTGCVAIGKYPQEPTGDPRFTGELDSGGIGSQTVKFIGVQVQGFDKGTVQLAVRYKDSEITGIDPNSLFLAVRGKDAWQKLDNLAVQTGASMAVGELQAAELLSGPVIALGSGEADMSGKVVPATGGLLASLNSLPMVAWVAFGVLAVVILVMAWLLIAKNKRKAQ